MLASQILSSPQSVKTKPQLMGLDDAWLILRNLVVHLKNHEVTDQTFYVSSSPDGGLEFYQNGNHLDRICKKGDSASPKLIVSDFALAIYHSPVPITDDARQLLDLFLPLCRTPLTSSFVVAHLAQSLDGRIATNEGASKFISAQEDLNHTHRLRAFFDAVVVGVGTALNDDPRLTTRLVQGAHPTRVIIDPQGKILPDCQLMNESDSPTLIITSEEEHPSPRKHVEYIRLPSTSNGIDPRKILEELSKRGLRRVFIEGGGITISRFLQAELVDRLHIAVAPTILGSGKPSFQLSPIVDLAQRLRLKWRSFQLGPDVLLDCVPCPATNAD